MGITSAIITLATTGEKNERVANRIASGTIIHFNKNEDMLKSDH